MKQFIKAISRENITSVSVIIFLFFGVGINIISLFISPSHQTAIKKLPKTEQKIETLDKNSPIHIGSGFDKKPQDEKPVRVVIPRLHIDLPIVEAPVIDGLWEVSDTAANHGQGSAYPGQKGNMVIFAHAREHLFLPLEGIQDGDLLYVFTDRRWYAYKVSSITAVLPEQTEVIAPTPDEQITLFTCTGFGDEKRLIVVGKREDLLSEK